MTKVEEVATYMFKEYPDFVDIEQMREMLGIKRTKSYELLKSGEIKSTRIGKDYKIMKINIIAYILGEEQI